LLLFRIRTKEGSDQPIFEVPDGGRKRTCHCSASTPSWSLSHHSHPLAAFLSVNNLEKDVSDAPGLLVFRARKSRGTFAVSGAKPDGNPRPVERCDAVRGCRSNIVAFKWWRVSATTPKYFAVASEVATMTLLRSSGLPIPKVYGYSPVPDNAAETEYIFMEFVQGTGLT
jgi:hypothetical protein